MSFTQQYFHSLDEGDLNGAFGIRFTIVSALQVGDAAALPIADGADPVFQEAITWQNPGLAQFLRDHDAGPGAARRSKQRQRELVIANYLQRYCLKNDTIGFFGQVGWASVAPGTAGLLVTPGQHLLARRTTYFEVWAIDKVADAIAREGRVLGWLRPRRTRDPRCYSCAGRRRWRWPGSA